MNKIESALVAAFLAGVAVIVALTLYVDGPSVREWLLQTLTPEFGFGMIFGLVVAGLAILCSLPKR